MTEAISICEQYKKFLLSPFPDAAAEKAWDTIIDNATSSDHIFNIFDALKTSTKMDRSERYIALAIEHYLDLNPDFYDALIKISQNPEVALQNSNYPETDVATNKPMTQHELDAHLLNIIERHSYCIHYINRLISEGANPNVCAYTSPLQLVLFKPDTEELILNLIEKGVDFHHDSTSPDNIIEWAEKRQCNPAYINLLKEGMAKRTPVSPIPKLIHFIWNGKPLPEDYKNNIINWANSLKTSGYQVILWTDENTLGNEAIKQELNEQGVILNHWRNRGQVVTIRNEQIDAMVTAIIALGKEEGHSENLSACSDILRAALLVDQGGLYVDTDNYITSTSDTPIGDINVITDIGARFIKTSKGFNGSFIAALPNSNVMNELVNYYCRLYTEGISAFPLATAEQIKAYPQYANKSCADEVINPEINPDRPDSAAWWVTKKGFFHGVDYTLGTRAYAKNTSIAVKFCATMGLVGPGIVKHFYECFKKFDLGCEASFFPRFGFSARNNNADVYQIGGTTGAIYATDGQHGTWQDKPEPAPMPIAASSSERPVIKTFFKSSENTEDKPDLNDAQTSEPQGPSA